MEKQAEKRKFHNLLFVKTCFWFAVIMSILSSLCYMLQSEPKPEYVGYLVELIENNPFTSYFCRTFTIQMS